MQDDPRQAIGAEGRVEAVNAAAFAAGIRRGMRRGEAEGICPLVVTVERDHSAEMVAFERVVAAIEELIPNVEIVEPGLIFVPVAGAVGYYGGEVHRRLPTHTGQYRIALNPPHHVLGLRATQRRQ